jgi:hypothetical protein
MGAWPSGQYTVHDTAVLVTKVLKSKLATWLCISVFHSISAGPHFPCRHSEGQLRQSNNATIKVDIVVLQQRHWKVVNEDDDNGVKTNVMIAAIFESSEDDGIIDTNTGISDGVADNGAGQRGRWQRWTPLH